MPAPALTRKTLYQNQTKKSEKAGWVAETARFTCEPASVCLETWAVIQGREKAERRSPTRQVCTQRDTGAHQEKKAKVPQENEDSRTKH